MRRYLSTAYKWLRHLVQGFAHRPQSQAIRFHPDNAWAHVIRAANRRQLLAPPVQQLHAQKDQGRLARWDAAIQRWLAHENSPYSYSWTIALNALGAEWAHQAWQDDADLAALTAMLERQITDDGQWRTPIKRVDHVMKGYSLLYAAAQTGNDRYWVAADYLADALLTQHPRACDGSLPYELATQAILVDTLAMVCPFLARYANMRQSHAARELSVQQLLRFIENNVDADTRLPYHGYYAGGPRRLGLHAWGRGVGWYMLGLVDTMAEIDPTHPAYAELRKAFEHGADALRSHQRADGHWSWAILQRHDTLDSSTTALVGYSLLRGLMLGVLGVDYRSTIDRALSALAEVTRADGVLDYGLGECRGLGKYPQLYGPQPWLQGGATAFAALYFKHFGEDRP